MAIGFDAGIKPRPQQHTGSPEHKAREQPATIGDAASGHYRHPARCQIDDGGHDIHGRPRGAVTTRLGALRDQYIGACLQRLPGQLLALHLADQQGTSGFDATGKRFGDLTDYDVKGQVDVRFASGSARISAQDQAALKKLAQDAISLKGYLIQVKGFTDSRGSAAINQKLSMERAQSVIAYLIQDCNVPVHVVITPGAMGEAAPVASNKTKSGRAENRRVEVNVLVNKCIAGI